MGAFRVIVFAPGGQRCAGLVQGRVQSFIQELVPQAAVEALDKGSLGRLSGCGVMPVEFAVIHELQDRVRGELGPVIADDRLWLAAGVEQRRQFTRDPSPRQRGVGDQGKAFLN
jgi:hypothetical protein